MSETIATHDAGLTSAAPTERPPLEGIRVLDLSGALGNYCGKLFADLGADVILVEPIDGATSRCMEPKIAGRSDSEASLHFQYNNTNKRSIVMDLGRPEGAELFRLLARDAHLMIETERPGVMEARGLGYETLREVAPQLVMTSITPFGQNGPYAQWKAEDIVGMALGGMMSLAGYFDSPPMAAFGYQAFAAANLFGAVASMAAVYEAEASGAGQHVDVAMQECVVMGMENAVQFFDLEGSIRKRNAGQQREAGSGVFQCKDGYIYLMAGGVGENRFWGNTVQWLIDEGVDGVEALKDERWLNRDYLSTEEAKETFKRIFSGFALRCTKLDLYLHGQERRIPIAPIADTADILQNRQLQARGFFAHVSAQSVDGAVGAQSWVMPGAPYRLGATPWSLRRPAPRLGEHTDEILAELEVDEARRKALREQGIVR